MRAPVFALFLLAAQSGAHANEAAIATIQAVGAEGKGNAAAAEAVAKITAEASPETLMRCLAAMDDASPLAANWLRSAAEVVAETCAKGDGLPVVELGEFLLDRSHNPRARRFAYELLATAQPDTAAALVPGLLNDPSAELRRDAVAALIDKAADLAKADNKPAATVVYRQALGAAVEPHQVKPIAEAIKELGGKVDLLATLGSSCDGESSAQFDNTDREGFAKVYPPEEKPFDPNAAFDIGEEADEARWQQLATSDKFGKVDFNKPYGMLKEKLAYTHTEFVSPTARAAELRIGTKNAFKVWLNGELVFARDEYHRGQRIDQYRLPVQLKAGSNHILMMSCQNEQTEEWTVQWEFQLRVCDATGAAILASNRQPTPEPENPRNRRRARKTL